MVDSENKRSQPINNYREKLLHYQLHVESHFDKFRVSFAASRFTIEANTSKREDLSPDIY